MTLIGQEGKYSNVCSGLILIGRGLDLKELGENSESWKRVVRLFSFEGAKSIPYAPLAQMVEQLTLNQWVLGSSPRWCTIPIWTPKWCVEMARWSSG